MCTLSMDHGLGGRDNLFYIGLIAQLTAAAGTYAYAWHQAWGAGPHQLFLLMLAFLSALFWGHWNHWVGLLISLLLCSDCWWTTSYAFFLSLAWFNVKMDGLPPYPADLCHRLPPFLQPTFFIFVLSVSSLLSFSIPCSSRTSIFLIYVTGFSSLYKVYSFFYLLSVQWKHVICMCCWLSYFSQMCWVFFLTSYSYFNPQGQIVFMLHQLSVRGGWGILLSLQGHSHETMAFLLVQYTHKFGAGH